MKLRFSIVRKACVLVTLTYNALNTKYYGSRIVPIMCLQFSHYMKCVYTYFTIHMQYTMRNKWNFKRIPCNVNCKYICMLCHFFTVHAKQLITIINLFFQHPNRSLSPFIHNSLRLNFTSWIPSQMKLTMFLAVSSFNLS